MIAVLLIVGLFILVVVSQSRLDYSEDNLRVKYADGSSRFTEIMGETVHFREEGSGPPVLLLHGISSSLHTWDAWAAALEDSFRVLRLDLPGFGLTGPIASRDYSQTMMTDFVAAFLDERGIAHCHLVGNSMGGGIACVFAIRFPERVDKLILVDAAGYRDPDKPPTLAFRVGRVPVLKQLMRYLTPRSLVEKSIREVYAAPEKITPELMDRYDAMLLAPGNREALIDRLNQPAEPQKWDYTQIDQPTLLLWGAQDAWIPVSHIDSFQRDLPQARAIVYPGVGHLPMEEYPESVSDARAFLRFAGSPVGGSQ